MGARQEGDEEKKKDKLATYRVRSNRDCNGHKHASMACLVQNSHTNNWVSNIGVPFWNWVAARVKRAGSWKEKKKKVFVLGFQ